MKISRLVLLLGALLFMGVTACATVTKVVTKEVPRMSVDGLNAHLNDPSYVIIDVRAGDDWNKSSAKIKGAIRETGDKVSEWASKYPKDKTIVLYCA